MNSKILYMETDGWGVISKDYVVVNIEDSFVDPRGITTYVLDFTNSWAWLDDNGNFAYVGSTFVLTDSFGVSGRFMCVGENSTSTDFYFVHIDGEVPAIIKNVTKIRLEDRFKLCTRIPDWVTGEDARKRWIPIIADNTFTTTTAVKIEGGLSPTNGFTLSCVYDLEYESYGKFNKSMGKTIQIPRLETMLSQDPVGNYVTRLIATEVEQEYQILSNTPIDAATFEIRPISVFYPDDIRTDLLQGDDYIEIPWINSEALAFIGRSSILTFAIRGIAGTLAQSHPKGSVLFKRLPTFLGASVVVWSTEASSFTQFQSVYFGIVENIVFRERLTAFDIELSSVLFPINVSKTQTRTNSQVYRSGKTGEEFFGDEIDYYPELPSEISAAVTYGDIDSRFRVFQKNYSDVWSWVRIGNLALKINRIGEVFPNSNPETPRDEFLTAYGFGISSTDRASEVRNQDILGNTWVAYFAAPYFCYFKDRDNPQAPYSPYEEDWDRANLIQLDDIQSDVISPFEELLYLVRSQRPVDFFNSQKATLDQPRRRRPGPERTETSDIGEFCAEYLNKEKLSLCHVFDKVQDLDERIRLGRVYDLPNANNLKSTANRVHVVDIILQILTSTGSNEYNSPYDLLPSELGFAIPIDRIDLDSFRTVSRRNKGLTVSNAYIDVSQTSPAEFLEDFLKDNLLCLSQGSDGRLVLVDLTALEIDPANAATDYTNFLTYNEGTNGFEIELGYEAVNVANTISYAWKEPWRIPSSPNRNIQAIVAPDATTLETGNTLAAVTNIYNRLRIPPIRFEPQYAPMGNNPYNILTPYPIDPISAGGVEVPSIARAGKYLSLYKKPVPVITVNLMRSNKVPTLRVGQLFRLTGIEVTATNGKINQDKGTITCFITDAQYDYITEVYQVKATILSFIRDVSLSRWHMGAKIEDIVFDAPNYVLTLSTNSGVTLSANSTLYLPEDEDAWRRDINQFTVGDTVTILDQYFTERLSFVIQGKNDFFNTIQTESDLSDVVIGDLLVPSTVDSVNTIYASSLIGINRLRLSR